MCHLIESTPTQQELNQELVELSVGIVESHWSRRLMQCRSCGQLFAKEFYEEVDWVNGNDPQFITYIPLAAAESFVELATNLPAPMSWRQHVPCLCSDWPSNAELPNLYWQR